MMNTKNKYYDVRYGDSIICVDDNVIYNKACRFIKKGETYKVGAIIFGYSFSLQGINPLYGLLKKESFIPATDYKKEVNKTRLNKIKILQRPKWYRYFYYGLGRLYRNRKI